MPAKTRPNKPSRRKRPQALKPPAPPRNPAMSVVRRFLRCAAGGSPANTGLPDGDPRLAVVLNKKFVLTLAPESGRIRFFLGVTPRGLVHVLQGTHDGTAAGVGTPEATSPDGMIASTSAGSDSVVLANLVGDSPVDWLASASTATAEWRVVNARHKLRFTGSSLANGGAVQIIPMDMLLGRSNIYNGDGSGFEARRVVASTSVINNQTVIGAARDEFSVLQMPRDTAYANVRDFIVNDSGATRAPFCPSSTDGKPTVARSPHPSLRIFEVVYTGLDASASVTVESDVCVQVVVGPENAMVPFAKPSEAAPQGVLTQILAAVGAAGNTIARNTTFQRILHSSLRSYSPALLSLLDG